MQEQYQQFLHFQKFLAMQGGPEASKNDSAQMEKKNVSKNGGKGQSRGGNRKRSKAATGADKENSVPVWQNHGQVEGEKVLEKKPEEPLKKVTNSAIMPAGESSDEEANKKDLNASCDSFDYAQKLVAAEEKLAKKQDRKKQGAEQASK